MRDKNKTKTKETLFASNRWARLPYDFPEFSISFGAKHDPPPPTSYLARDPLYAMRLYAMRHRLAQLFRRFSELSEYIDAC